jgi:hypothetical protein
MMLRLLLLLLHNKAHNFIMSEPIGIYLMPIYAIGCWYGLYAHGATGKHLLSCALVGWIWAIINITRSKRIDLGVVTFGLVILSTLCERYNGYTRFVRWTTTISSIFVAVNFSLVLIFWKPIQKDLAKSRSVIWLKVFVSYCACLMIFWLISAYTSFFRGETSTSSFYESVQPPP